MNNGFFSAVVGQHAGQIILSILWTASVVVVGLFVERQLFFRRNFLRQQGELLKQLDETRTTADVRGLLEKHISAETGILLDALESAGGSRQRFRDAYEGRLSLRRAEWERFAGLFAWVSSSAPLAGLLGTVAGLMRSFTDLAFAEDPSPKIAFAGISDALLTTVAGILVAIPATAFYNACKLRSKRAAETVVSLGAVIASRPVFEEEDALQPAAPPTATET